MVAATRIIHFYDRASIVAVWRGLFGKEPAFWECECGCHASFAYGRVGSTVWIQPCFSAEDEGDTPLLGIDNEAQLRALASATDFGAIRGLVAVLRPLVPGAVGADA